MYTGDNRKPDKYTYLGPKMCLEAKSNSKVLKYIILQISFKTAQREIANYTGDIVKVINVSSKAAKLKLDDSIK